MSATIQDLKRELWLRRRFSGELKWQTRDGKEIQLKNMATEHIENVIEYYSRKEYHEDNIFE